MTFFKMNLVAKFSSFLFCRLGLFFDRTKVKFGVAKQFVTFICTCLQ